MASVPGELSTMQPLLLPQLSLASVIVAITSHVLYFSRHERDSLASTFFGCIFLIPAVIFSGWFWYFEQSILESIKFTATICGSFALGLGVCIFVYRVWFHPLRNIPGPFWARVSKFWGVWKSLESERRYHLVIYEMHKKYGDVVRVGPNEVTVIHQDIVPVLSRASKGPWYNIGSSQVSVMTTRNKETHRIRRRVWDKALTGQAIQDYIPRILHHSSKLVSHISSRKSTPVDIAQMFSFYSFDVMGDITFGHQFRMMELQGKNDVNYLQLLHSSANMTALLGHVSWVFGILFALPCTWVTAAYEFERFAKWCGEIAEERIKDDPGRRDLFSWLLLAESENQGVHYCDLLGESRLAIVAGSDTTSSSLINIFLQLACSPSVFHKLQNDIDALYQSTSQEEEIPKKLISGGTAATRYLEAVIFEAHRLNPIIPSGLQRVIPPGGVEVAGKWIAGGVNAYFPQFAAYRDEKNFKNADQFIPERWCADNIDHETLVRQKKIFTPFGLGSNSCAGKNLASMQIRVVTARIVRNFNISSPPGAALCAQKVIENCRDCFTLDIGAEINVVFTER